MIKIFKIICLFSLILFLSSCEKELEVNKPVDDNSGINSLAKGNGELGSDLVLMPSTGLAVGGVGMLDKTEGTFNVEVPADVEIKHVFLYWTARSAIVDTVNMTSEDDNAVLNGSYNVEAELIGYEYMKSHNIYSVGYRADITDLGIITNGTNSVTVGGLDYVAVGTGPISSSKGKAEGAGVVVVYDDKNECGEYSYIEIRDGADFAWSYSYSVNEPDTKVTKEQVFTFAPSSEERYAEICIMVGDAESETRPDGIIVEIGLDNSTTITNVLNADEGLEFDIEKIPVVIPPYTESVSVQVYSGNEPNPNDESLNWIYCSLMIEKDECGPCGECEGKVSWLTLKYTGDQEANIKVYQKDKSGKLEVFNDNVAPNGEFTFAGIDKKLTLGTEIYIFIDDVYHTKIHTSCSQPIDIGFIFGDFIVMDGASREGGEFCGTTPIPDPDPDCGECEGKVSWLTLQYNGQETSNIRVFQKDKNGHLEVFNGYVDANGEFTFAGMDKKLTLGTEIYLFVNNCYNAKIHTSCSKPIDKGFIFGDFTVIDGASREGGEFCGTTPIPDPVICPPDHDDKKDKKKNKKKKNNKKKNKKGKQTKGRG